MIEREQTQFDTNMKELLEVKKEYLDSKDLTRKLHDHIMVNEVGTDKYHRLLEEYKKSVDAQNNIYNKFNKLKDRLHNNELERESDDYCRQL